MSDQNNEWESATATNSTWEPAYRGLDKEADDARTVGDKDDILDGYYIGARPVKTKNGERFVHTVETSEGTKRDVWGSKMLNEELDKIRPGQYIRIQWLGKFPTKAGALIPEKKRGPTDSFQKWEIFINKNVAPLTGYSSPNTSTPAPKTNSVPPTKKAVVPEEDDNSDLPF